MLVISRQEEEEVKIGPDIVVRICRISSRAVRLGITAPPTMKVLRSELPEHLPHEEEPLGTERRPR